MMMIFFPRLTLNLSSKRVSQTPVSATEGLTVSACALPSQHTQPLAMKTTLQSRGGQRDTVVSFHSFFSVFCFINLFLDFFSTKILQVSFKMNIYKKTLMILNRTGTG